MVSDHALFSRSVLASTLVVVVVGCICVLLCMEFVESASSDDDWDVEDVEADDGHSVEALGSLRSGHGDVEEAVDVVGQELDS